MTRKLFMAMFFIVCTKAAVAQPGRGQFEVSASVGAISGMYILDRIALGGPDDNDQMVDNSQTLNYFVSGKYFVSDRFALGLTYGQKIIHGEEDLVRSSRAYPQDYFKRVDVTYAVEVTFIYVTRPYFQAYALAGLGLDPQFEYFDYGAGNSMNKRQNITQPTKQWTPIGIRVGGRIAGYLEVGLGYKGLANAGICYSIGKSDGDGMRVKYVQPY